LRDLLTPRRRVLTYRLPKSQARELHDELDGLWRLYHDAEHMLQWLRRLGAALPAGHVARVPLAHQLRSARQNFIRIRQGREGDKS
jgi:hypothetical protein